VTTPSDDSDLRGLLHEAVSDVEPHGTLDHVHARATRQAPVTRGWLLPALTAAAATVAVIGGVALLTVDSGGDESTTAAQGPAEPGNERPADREEPPAPQPTEGASPRNTSPGQAATVTSAVPAYFVGDTAQGPRLFREFQRQEICPGEECQAAAAVRTAVEGSAADPDYRSPWPAGVAVGGVTWDGEVLTVDLTGTGLRERPAGVSAQEARAALQQVVYSAQAGLGQGRPPVQLLVDGVPSDRVLGEPAAEPLTAADADSALAPVWVHVPTEGAVVPPRFEVTGQAATFEANVVWELKQGETVVREGFTTAEQCCTLSPYSFTVSAPPGEYTLVVHDTDESDGEGVGTSEDTKRDTVR
jgi:hypothetical protein